MEIFLIRSTFMSLDYFAAFILALILVCCLFEENKTALLKIYTGMAAACTAALFLEAVSLSVSFAGIPNENIIRTALNNTSIVCGYGLSFSYACYVINLVGPEQKHCRRALSMLKILGVTAVAYLIFGSFRSLFYSIRSQGITPGSLFGTVFVYDIIACLAGIVLIIIYRKRLNTRDIVALMSLPAFIFVSAVLQFSIFKMMYGLFVMAAMSVFIIYLMIQTERSRRTAEQEKQLVDMNVALMLSQIQPHFLYNTLSSIRRMIKKEPEVAETAVENFSLYLRQNLESMTRAVPISFREELRHVEEYLYLEKLRFGERLRVEYSIGFTDFSLPPLTLQPIVENAVKHGIMKREEGGRIEISVRREGGAALLTVKDNGVGFVPDAPQQKEGLHVGISNVERRIRMQCRGSLKVESEPGKGTRVTMSLPLI